MSFTAEVKDELAHVQHNCKLCGKAELAAIVRIQGTLTISAKQPRLEISTDNVALARRTIDLSHKLYKLKTELTVRRSILHRSNNYLITIPAQTRLIDALSELGVFDTDGFKDGIEKKLISKDCCAGSYVRGAFLAGGYIADPNSSFHLEIATSNERFAHDIAKLLCKYNIAASTKTRHNTYSIYVKNADSISAFLAFVKAQKSVLKFEDIRVFKSVRNDTNRRVNAEIANAEKATKASVQQIENIRYLLQNCDYSELPNSLVEVARLRLEHTDASIKELGTFATPPLSKNAVYHRMRRLNAYIDNQRELNEKRSMDNLNEKKQGLMR